MYQLRTKTLDLIEAESSMKAYFCQSQDSFILRFSLADLQLAA